MILIILLVFVVLVVAGLISVYQQLKQEDRRHRDFLILLRTIKRSSENSDKVLAEAREILKNDSVSDSLSFKQKPND